MFVEFSNVLATYERLGEISTEEADSLLEEADKRIVGAANLPAKFALRLARQYSVSAYDALFLAAAEAFGEKLVTEDAKLRTAAPGLTLSLAEALISR